MWEPEGALSKEGAVISWLAGWRRWAAAVVMSAVVGWALISVSHAQTIHLEGQSIQPVYEGWERNADGTFTMVFGYLNRNYEEVVDIPAGPENRFSPGPIDRGQPTHFYPRRQSFLFFVTVPADWGAQKLIWTVTRGDETFTAVGKLMPVWEIDEGVWNATRLGSVAGTTPEGNAPPTITAVGESEITAVVGTPVRLSVTASDDGKPGPASGRRAGAGQSRAGSDPPLVTTTGLPTRTIGRRNPYMRRDVVRFADARATGLAVTWIQWRGSGQISFDPMVVPIASEDLPLTGTAETSVRFSAEGEYVVRAYADEGVQTRAVDFTVTVMPGPQDASR